MRVVGSLEIGDFTLQHPEGDVLNHIGGMLSAQYSEKLADRGADFKSCTSYPEPERSVLHLAVIENGEPVGVFNPYSLVTLDFDGVTRLCTARPAPVLPDVGSEKWIDTVVSFLGYFLSNPVQCDGEILRVQRWEFPTRERGFDPAHEWSHDGASVADSDVIRAGFVEACSEAGLAITTNEILIPDRVQLPSL